MTAAVDLATFNKVLAEKNKLQLTLRKLQEASKRGIRVWIGVLAIDTCLPHSPA